MKKTTFQYMALGGIAGPFLFTIIMLICSSLREDYNHIAHFISELGATGTPNADLMNFGGFIPAGTMIALFGLSLSGLLPKRFLARRVCGHNRR